jgi:flagellar biosynthesis/type III secretory pathway chaperone
MTLLASAVDQAALEAALRDVHAAVAELLAAAAEQRAALEAGDRDRLEQVTCLQERLTARLAQAERRRMACLATETLEASVASLPGEPGQRVRSLMAAIREKVIQLREQHGRNAALLQRSLELTGQTVQFLQRLVIGQPPTYTPTGATAVASSLLLDHRA